MYDHYQSLRRAATERFLSRYDCVAICGCFRFGSTALAQKITQFFIDKGRPALFLNEIFTNHHFLSHGDDGQLRIESLPMDTLPFGNDPRAVRAVIGPRPDSLFRAKLAWLSQNMSHTKMIIKLDPDDWLGTNGELLEEFVLDNPRVYAIGLNREDVDNAIISYLIGTHFNFWNFGAGDLMAEYGREVVPVSVVAADVQGILDLILLHNNWLWYMRDRLDRLVWFDRLETLRIPEIGLVDDVVTWTVRHPVPHKDRLVKYFTNPVDVAEFAAAARHNLSGLIDAVKQRYNTGRPRP